ncbi:MAG: 50S ribosomal protein L24, partial [Merismopedia sp. SIO2A8]|nr:50S ribosomal protein L24 [Merismopedia sp. SIO2A8]
MANAKRKKSQHAIKMHVKRGDTVQVISGSDKGKVGEITQVFPKLSKVIVDG